MRSVVFFCPPRRPANFCRSPPSVCGAFDGQNDLTPPTRLPRAFLPRTHRCRTPGRTPHHARVPPLHIRHAFLPSPCPCCGLCEGRFFDRAASQGRTLHHAPLPLCAFAIFFAAHLSLPNAGSHSAPRAASPPAHSAVLFLRSRGAACGLREVFAPCQEDCAPSRAGSCLAWALCASARRLHACDSARSVFALAAFSLTPPTFCCPLLRVTALLFCCRGAFLARCRPDDPARSAVFFAPCAASCALREAFLRHLPGARASFAPRASDLPRSSSGSPCSSGSHQPRVNIFLLFSAGGVASFFCSFRTVLRALQRCIFLLPHLSAGFLGASGPPCLPRFLQKNRIFLG